MNVQREAGSDGRIVRRYEYDDSSVLVADVGASTDEVDVDVVGTTAIVVADRGDEIDEVEFELPDGDATVAANNGIVTIEVAR
jgi:hypothetical protein